MPVKVTKKAYHAKRGDTLIEVMIAMAILAVVTIVTVTMMNSGLNVAERSLELTTARNELNAQAEALRFIHSSYISEINLPECSSITGGEVRCQAFKPVWDEIVGQTINIDLDGDRAIQFPITDCEKFIYGDGKSALIADKAFIINTRLLQSPYGSSPVSTKSIIKASGTGSNVDLSAFQMPDLNARILYSSNDDDTTNGTKLTELGNYTKLVAAQGIWVVGVQSEETGGSGKPLYYDFHIETCWNNAGNDAPSSLDAVIRLYNPAARS